MIVEQEARESYKYIENQPDWLIDMHELILVVQHFTLDFLERLYNDVGTDGGDADFLTWYNESSCVEDGDFYTLNGQYQPTICLESGVWKRLRIINPDYVDSITMYFDNPSCELKLISRDGILLSNSPRNVSHIWLTTGNRADVAIRCISNQTYDFNSTLNEENETFEIHDQNGDIYGFVELFTSLDTQFMDYTELTPFVPKRATYTPDLMNYEGEFQEFTTVRNNGRIRVTDFLGITIRRNSINGVSFTTDTDPINFVDIGSVVELDIIQSPQGDVHPFHLHVYPFQVIDGGFNTSHENQDIPVNWHEPGDYMDVLYGFATVRFRASTFGGDVMMHCHLV